MSHSHEGMEIGDRCWDCLNEAFTIKVDALEKENGEQKVLINCLRAHLTREAARVSEEEKKSEAFKAGFMKVKKEKDEGIELIQEAKRLITALTRAIAVLSPYSPAEARASCEYIVSKAIETRDLL